MQAPIGDGEDYHPFVCIAFFSARVFLQTNSLHYQWQKTVTKNVDVIALFFPSEQPEC